MDIEKWNTQLRKGVLEFCILSILEKKESYGYQIIQALSDFTGIDIKRGTIYALFKRLEEEGYVNYSWEESNAGPPRKIYSLTPKGKETLKIMKKHWDVFLLSIKKITGGEQNG